MKLNDVPSMKTPRINIINLGMKNAFFTLLPAILLLSCSGDKKPKEEAPSLFPVNSFILSQVAHVDTSLYSIRKIEPRKDGGNDTTYFQREQFRSLAREFLDLPDLTRDKFEGRYTKESRFDEMLNRLIITMLPVNPREEEIQRAEVLIQPDPSGDRVTSIIIDTYMSNRDSSVQKRLLWQVDESFQVAIIKQLKAQPETTSTYRVVWNEPEPQYTEEENKENE